MNFLALRPDPSDVLTTIPDPKWIDREPQARMPVAVEIGVPACASERVTLT